VILSTAAAAVTVLVPVVGGAGTERRFFRRRGRSAGMSVAVYLRAMGASARARRPVPALSWRYKDEVSSMLRLGAWWRGL
jgi:hypothetical protein